ncbi:hypothetical protein HYS96_01950 [Candidatus Daviesbacteria bacterium]|nr:hypothetical protein [Candidatus Daviesbacteria bacterium]
MKKYTPFFKVTPYDKRKYLLPEDRDYEILDKCKRLEKSKLTIEDKYLVKFIKTQLKKDWRRPLLVELDRLLRKYS